MSFKYHDKATSSRKKHCFLEGKSRQNISSRKVNRKGNSFQEKALTKKHRIL